MSAADGKQVQAAAAAEPAELQKPKKALTSYWLFLNEVREVITKELKEKNNGKAQLGEISKEVKARWSALSEADKKVFEDKAVADKERYASEFKAYLEASDPAGTLRKKYAEMMPKKPLTAYFSFSQDPAWRGKASEALKAAGTAEPTFKQIASKLGELWKAASSEEKAVFEERYKKEQAEFFEKQKVWQATPEFKEIEAAEKAQDEKRRASEAPAEGGEETAAKGKKRGRSVAKGQDQETPEKPKEKQPKPTGSEAKRAKKADGKKGAAPAAELDEEVLKEAAKLGWEGSLRNLAGRPEVLASGKKASELLQALRASEGLVNPAKRALLGM